MTHLKQAALAAALFTLTAAAGQAGTIERACNGSDRSASRQLCACIQQVADMTLQGSDQRRAASFFKDPERAQKVKMSKRDADDSFWDRYRQFGEMAEAYCAN